jgi:hypothetical protein
VNLVFADAFYWVALIHRKDASHKAVLEFSRTLASIFITTDEVLTEVLAFCSADEGLRADAVKTVRRILTARNVKVQPQSRDSFLDWGSACAFLHGKAHTRPCLVLRGRKSGYALSKNISTKGPLNSRSLHYAPRISCSV